VPESKLRYAERMFPEPKDLGIAEADRAVCSVTHGTSTYQEKQSGEGEHWFHGGGKVGERAVQNIVIYPPTRGLQTQGDPFEPVKIGVLVDMDLGQLLADWIDPTILAIEDALNEGIWARSPVEIITADARGLPRENYRKVIQGYQWLVEQGCVVVLGPMISDNSITLQDTVDRTGVPVIGWTGAHKFASEYCFTVANGDIPSEGVICAHWLKNQGLRKVGLFWEAGSSGRDYADYFRYTALQLGLTITREVMIEPNPRGLDEALREMKALGTEGIYYGGYGYACYHFGPALKALNWDPPKIMGTAFMFYSNTNRWEEGIDGWHGCDQLAAPGTNPNYEAMIRRFEARFGRKTKNVVVALAYDTARAAIHGIANAKIPIPKEVKEGLERIRWMPCTNGGPATYVTFGPGDHKGYKGDFLVIWELRDKKLTFKEYIRPQWPSNAR
jgi:ABC-type branched-subunit amino acid transport system substrate-binding protein